MATTGILVMPYVLGKCGIIPGLLLFSFCGLLCKVACHSLILSTKRAAVDSYEALCEGTFGRPGRCVAYCCQLVEIQPRNCSTGTHRRTSTQAQKELLRGTPYRSKHRVISIMVAVVQVRPAAVDGNLHGMCLHRLAGRPRRHFAGADAALVRHRAKPLAADSDAQCPGLGLDIPDLFAVRHRRRRRRCCWRVTHVSKIDIHINTDTTAEAFI